MSNAAQAQATSFMLDAKNVLTLPELSSLKSLVAQLKVIKRDKHVDDEVCRQMFEKAAVLFSSRRNLATRFTIFIPAHIRDSYTKFIDDALNTPIPTPKQQEVISNKPINTPSSKEEENICIEETDEETESAQNANSPQKHEGRGDSSQENLNTLQVLSRSQQEVVMCTFSAGDIPSKLWDTLFPFQRDGVEIIVKSGGRMLLADEMGLGKTFTALAVAAYYHKTDWPLLVVCPAGVRKVWEAAIRRWLPTLLVEGRSLFAPLGSASALCVVDSEHGHMIKSSAKVVIVSYDLLSALAADSNYGMVICDESHFLKSTSSLRSQQIMPLLHKAKRLLLLSGTPCLSNSAELFTQLHALSPLPSASAFFKRYSNNQHLDELHALLKPLMLRRLKRDVLPEALPPKTRKVVMLPNSSESVPELSDVKRDWETISRQLAADMEGQLAGQILQLYMQAGVQKLRQVCQYVLRLCTDPTNKVLVFGHHKKVLKGIQACLQQVGILHIFVDGQVTGTDRASRLDRFQIESELRVAILSLTAVGQGATLTAANHCVFAELAWTPGQLLQAEDRVHRLGQIRPTFVHYLLGSGSLDEALWPLLERKLGATSLCLDNQNNDSFAAMLLA